MFNEINAIAHFKNGMRIEFTQKEDSEDIGVWIYHIKADIKCLIGVIEKGEYREEEINDDELKVIAIAAITKFKKDYLESVFDEKTKKELGF